MSEKTTTKTGAKKKESLTRTEQLTAAMKFLGTTPATETRPSEEYRRMELGVDTLLWRQVSIPVSVSDSKYLANNLGATAYTTKEFANEGGEFGGNQRLRWPNGYEMDCNALAENYWNAAVGELCLNVHRWNANTPNSRWIDPFSWTPDMQVTVEVAKELSDGLETPKLTA